TELMFPHHEAEIAQAEAFTGVAPFVRYWMHGGMLTVSGEEMHKSLGNFWAVKDALARYEPEVVRFFLIHAQYRSPVDLTAESIAEAERSYARLRGTIRTLEAARRRAATSGTADAPLAEATREALRAFDASMEDDFNTREALAAIFEFARHANKAIDAGAGKAALDGAAAAFDTFGQVLGLFRAPLATTDVVDGLMDLIVALREDARTRKDFVTADRIRDALTTVGIVLEDTRDGVRWKRR
ncbi:MAG: DALR domain-containing protein, partial [Methanobacteriota archaeon]